VNFHEGELQGKLKTLRGVGRGKFADPRSYLTARIDMQ
jgi:hypothetical protein